MDEKKRKEVWQSLEIYFSKIAILEAEIEDIFMSSEGQISFAKNKMTLARKEFLRFIDKFHTEFCFGNSKVFVLNSLSDVDLKATWRAMQDILDEQTLEALVLIFKRSLNPMLHVDEKMLRRIDPLISFLGQFPLDEVRPLFTKLFRMANALIKYGSISEDLIVLLRDIFDCYDRNDLQNFRNADLVLNLIKNLEMLFLHKANISHRHRLKVKQCVEEIQPLLMNVISHSASDLSHNDSNALNSVSRTMIALDYLLQKNDPADESVIEDLSQKLEECLSSFSSYLNDINDLFDDGSYLDWESRMQLLKLRDVFVSDSCPAFVLDAKSYVDRINTALVKIDASYVALQQKIIDISSKESRNVVYGCIYDISESFKFSEPKSQDLMQRCNAKLAASDPLNEDLDKMALVVNSIFCYMMSLNEAKLWNDFVAFRNKKVIARFLKEVVDLDSVSLAIVPFLPFVSKHVKDIEEAKVAALHLDDYKVTYEDLAHRIRDLFLKNPDEYHEFCNAAINAMARIKFCSRNGEDEYDSSQRATLMKLFTISTLFGDLHKGSFLRQKFSYLRLAYDLDEIFVDLDLDTDQKKIFSSVAEEFRTRYPFTASDGQSVEDIPDIQNEACIS